MGGLGVLPLENLEIRSALGAILCLLRLNTIFPIYLRYFLKENRLFYYFIKKVKSNYFFHKYLN